jgi:hypothetical protein
MSLNVDKIALTLPSDDAFHRVAHLVLGGFADRHNLTVETLDELTLALDTVLERYGESADEVTMCVGIVGEEVHTEVGPFRDTDVRAELERESADALDLRRILGVLCDSVSVSDRDGGEWIELRKNVDRAEGAAA